MQDLHESTNWVILMDFIHRSPKYTSLQDWKSSAGIISISPLHETTPTINFSSSCCNTLMDSNMSLVKRCGWTMLWIGIWFLTQLPGLLTIKISCSGIQKNVLIEVSNSLRQLWLKSNAPKRVQDPQHFDTPDYCLRLLHDSGLSNIHELIRPV